MLEDPEWLPHTYDASTGQVQFVHLTRADHRAATFLSDQYIPGQAPRRNLSNGLRMGGGSGERAASYIFHSAFARSTLLTRVFDVPGLSMGLKEPAILNALAGLPTETMQALLPHVLPLLARPFDVGEVVIVKPSNVVNPLIGPILETQQTTRAILLYSPLPNFLRSVARKGLFGRNWARQLFAHLKTKMHLETGFSSDALFEQTDLQIAALGWLTQQAHFANIIRAYPSRVRSLSSETLVSRKSDVLDALADHFNLSGGSEARSRLAGSSAFLDHSKELGKPFAEQQAETPRDLDMFCEDEIEKVVAWTTAVGAWAEVPLTMPGSLI